LQHVLELGRTQVRERAPEYVNAPASGFHIGKLNSGKLVDLVGGAQKNTAPGVGVVGLPAERTRRRVVTDGAEVVEHAVDLGLKIARPGSARRGQHEGRDGR